VSGDLLMLCVIRRPKIQERYWLGGEREKRDRAMTRGQWVGLYFVEGDDPAAEGGGGGAAAAEGSSYIVKSSSSM
jgi:hypothetical protein